MKYKIDTERVDLFDVSIVITMCVKIKPMPSFEALETAFEKACKLNEVLNSKVVIEADGEAFYVDNGKNSNSICKTEKGLTELIYENEKKRFRIEDGEFMRSFVSPDGLIFIMHHLGGDGKSLVYFIETFMNCLAGIDCGYRPFKNLALEDLPKDSGIPFAFRLLCDLWNKKWKKDKKVFNFPDMDEAYERFWESHGTHVEIREYMKGELDQLLGRAKAAHVSLTSLLVCDMLKNFDGKADVGFAVDGRQDGNRLMGNQATGISITYRYDRKKTFDRNAAAIHKLMQKKLSDNRYRFFVLHFMGRLDPTLKDALNLEHAGCFSSKISSKIADYLGYGEKVKDISITNLTRVDIPTKYGEYAIEQMAFVPPVVSYAKNVIGIVTVGDRMTVVDHRVEKG